MIVSLCLGFQHKDGEKDNKTMSQLEHAQILNCLVQMSKLFLFLMFSDRLCIGQTTIYAYAPYMQSMYRHRPP